MNNDSKVALIGISISWVVGLIWPHPNILLWVKITVSFVMTALIIAFNYLTTKKDSEKNQRAINSYILSGQKLSFNYENNRVYCGDTEIKPSTIPFIFNDKHYIALMSRLLSADSQESKQVIAHAIEAHIANLFQIGKQIKQEEKSGNTSRKWKKIEEAFSKGNIARVMVLMDRVIKTESANYEKHPDKDVAIRLFDHLIIKANTLKLTLTKRLSPDSLFSKIQDCYEHAIKIGESGFIDDASYVQVLFNSAEESQRFNKFDDALAKFEKALDIYRKLTDVNPSAYTLDVANTLNSLALLHINYGKLEDAETEYEEALKIQRELAAVKPFEHTPYVAATFNNLANLHKEIGKLKEAEAEYREALRIFRELAANQSAYTPNVGITLDNIAMLHIDTNMFEDAETEYEEALKIQRELAAVKPSEHTPYVAAAFNNLANLHVEIGKLKEAEAEYREALRISHELAAVNPVYLPNVATAFNNLADLHRDTGKPEDAEIEYQEALRIFRELANTDKACTHDVATALNDLANLHIKNGKPEDAEAEYKEALKILRELATSNPSEYTPEITTTLNNIAILHIDTNMFEDAKEEIDEILTICNSNMTSNPLYTSIKEKADELQHKMEVKKSASLK